MALSASNYNASQLAVLSIGGIGSLVEVDVDSVVGLVPAGGTGAAAGGWDTSGHRDTAITTVTELKTAINQLQTQLAAMGLPIVIDD